MVKLKTDIDSCKNFVMELKQVNDIVEKKQKPFNADKIFDKSGGDKIKVGKKEKKKDPNNMSMSFYNMRSKSYQNGNK